MAASAASAGRTAPRLSSDRMYPSTDGESNGKRREQDSRKALTQMRNSGLEHISSIKVAVTAREAARRADEPRVGRSRTRAAETFDGEDAAGQIESEWKRLSELQSRGPRELFELLTSQKRSCEELVESKKALIAQLTEELRAKDEDYVRELKRHGEEIDVLRERMHAQYETFVATSAAELKLIEKTSLDERSALVVKSNQELDSILEKRRTHEQKGLLEREERIEHDIAQLENMRVHDSEDYNLTKIKLESDVQALEQQLQQMRATYQLNSEKLEYNYQVLTKREEENLAMLNANKRKITRLTDIMNGLRSRLAKQERHFEQDVQNANEDLNRLLEQYQELQKKCHRFEQADHKKLEEIGKLNEDVALDLARKVLEADRIIHEQQLGLRWENPTSSRPLMHAIGNRNEEIPTHKNVERGDSVASMFMEQAASNGTVRRVLDLLGSEATFLIENKLQVLLAPLPQDEANLLKLDCIFKALSLETAQDITRLVGFFLRKPENIGGNDANEERELIHPNEVNTALRRFMEETIATAGSTANVDGANSSRKLNESSVQYWQSLSEVLSDEKYRIWKSTFAAMEEHNRVLSERWALWEDIRRTERQNAELKGLLRQYFTAPINDDLEIPPTTVLLERLLGS